MLGNYVVLGRRSEVTSEEIVKEFKLVSCNSLVDSAQYTIPPDMYQPLVNFMTIVTGSILDEGWLYVTLPTGEKYVPSLLWMQGRTLMFDASAYDGYVKALGDE